MLNNETIKCFKTHCIRRVRASTLAMMYELGNKSKNYYHACSIIFLKLHKTLKDEIDKKPCNFSRRSRNKRKRGYTPTGLTHSSILLSVALRNFSGGCTLGIALVHGVSPTEVLNSAWIVVEAVCNTSCLNMQFPECHAKQRETSRNFQAVSSADFDNRCGAIDGLLTWIAIPNNKDTAVSAVSVKKLCCGCKKNCIEFTRGV